ncbi:hypothetical protein [Demequina sp.]|uniref:hypothetical protein n=1 Tax=Demequina sp. TaxID=2050685 RepID=UPI003A8AFBBE
MADTGALSGQWATVAAAAIGGLAVLAGCSPVLGTDAMVEESDHVLSFAEDVIPSVAQSLDLTVIEAESTPETGGGLEGSSPRFWFGVEGEFAGELPSQAALEEAMTAAGLTDITSEQMNGSVGTDTDPYATATDPDRAVRVSVTSVTGMADDGLRFHVRTVDGINVSDEAIDEYFPDLVPQFDQSLVSSSAAAGG